jgi:23S rRNA (cytosine1962-C5)-methyltransferase
MTLVNDDPTTRPTVRLAAGRSKRVRGGYPWAFSNEIEMTPETKALPPGSLASVEDAGGEKLGVAIFNPHSLIAARFLARDSATIIDSRFFAASFERSLRLRETLFEAPFYRLIHAEADGLPGLIIDRYGDVLAVQANSAGMDRLTPAIIEGLEQVLSPRAIVLANDSPTRSLEGLSAEHRLAKGVLEGPVEIIENGARFLADLAEGQKTGWFFDQRDNRAFMAKLAKGRRAIDFYSYAGGFGLQMALGGASEVIMVDGSASALELAKLSASLNGVAARCRFVRSEAFTEMERLSTAKERFGVVVADPPAFVKSKKDLMSGLKGYRKMSRLAAGLVEAEGFLLIASCSHHVSLEALAEEASHGLRTAGRTGRLLRSSGAGPDHPIHPMLPESAYLKALVYQLD